MKLNPNIVFREEFDGQGIIFNPDNGETYGVNPIATFIWKELDAGRTREEILSNMTEITDPPPNAGDDLDAFLKLLIEKGYLAE